MKSLPCCSLLVAVLAASAPAQTLRLGPVADATTDQSQPSVNFGSSAELSFGKNYRSSPTFQVWFLRGHVQFDVTPIVATGRMPVRALFHWYQSRSSAAGCLDVTLHRVLAPWSESTVTWLNQPAHDPIALTRACVGDSFANGWKTFDVTGLVQAWLSGGTNYGFVIRDPTERTAGAARPGFGHSRETASAALAPYLEVEFTDRFGGGCSGRGAIPALDLVVGQARIGGWMTVQAAPLLPNTVPGMLFGTSNSTWGGRSLPLSLAFAGLPGCDLLVAPDIAVLFPTSASGFFYLTLTWPNDPSLDGQRLYMQAVAVPPSSSVELTNGVGFTFHR